MKNHNYKKQKDYMDREQQKADRDENLDYLDADPLPSKEPVRSAEETINEVACHWTETEEDEAKLKYEIMVCIKEYQAQFRQSSDPLVEALEEANNFIKDFIVIAIAQGMYQTAERGKLSISKSDSALSQFKNQR